MAAGPWAALKAAYQTDSPVASANGLNDCFSKKEKNDEENELT